MKLASSIDHTLLKPEATSAQLRKLCEEALEYQLFGVCVNSGALPFVASLLKNTPVKMVSVIGFPLGAMSTEAKAFEAQWCAKQGAHEIDMVLNIGALKDQNWDLVKKDIQAVVHASGSAKVKVILETGLLTEEEKIRACQLTVEAGAHFVKTCTGFNVGAATVEDIQLMRKTVGPQFGVKASGGIKTPAQAIALIEAGADRLGTSSGVQLVQNQNSLGGY